MKRLRILQLRNLLLSAFLLANTLIVNAQTVVTINATGTTGSFRTGGVNSTGTKVDGNLVNVSTTTGNNRGWAVFDLSTIPAGATIQSVNIIFTTYSSTLSTATNSIRGTTGNPASITGTALYSQLNTGTLLNSASWAANTTITAAVSATGLAFFQANIGANNVIIGFVRGSTNVYNIYGYPGTPAQVPKLEITYLTPCSGTPTAGTVNGPSSVCPTQNFTLSLAGASTSAGLTYQWQSKLSSSGTFANITGGTNSTLTTSITIPSDFRCVVRCSNSTLSATTPAVSIGINSFYACYCKGSLGGSSAASIDSVTILQTTLANASPGTTAGSYTQYAAAGNTTADLQAGGLYMIYAKYGSSAIGSVWIDANRNGTYETSEWTQINTTGTSGLAVLRIPPGAFTGLTGMRVRSANAGSANAAGNPCTNFSSGETEDYIINIIPAPVNDLKFVTYLSPLQAGLCPFKDVEVKAVIYNNGTSPQSNFPITTQLNGPYSNTHIYTRTGILPPFTTDTILLTTYSLGFTGVYNVQSYVGLVNDVNINNDSSVLFTFNIKPNANTPVVRNDSACYTHEAMLHVLPDIYKHRWYRNANYTGQVFEGDTMKIPNILADSFLYVCSFTADDTASLLTTTSGGNGCGGGAMFNIVPTVNIKVDSFAAVFGTTGTQTVNVYYRAGTFAGFETNSGAWTLLGTTSVNVSSTTALTRFTVNVPLNLAASNTYGIYINYDATYTNGTTTFSNADMAVQTGTGLCSQFGGTNAGRMFNGRIYYSKGSALCESPLVPIRAYAGPEPIVNLGTDLYPCEGQDIILDAGFSGGTYIWNTLQTTQTINVKNATGTYWVQVDKYCTASDTVTVTFQPLPSSSGIAYTRLGNDYSFSASGLQNTNQVIWIFGDGSPNAYGNATTHTYTMTGPIRLFMVIMNDCGTDTITLDLPLNVPAINMKGEDVTIYPNPATEKITVQFTDNQNKYSSFEIVNSIGVIVLKQNEINLNNSKMNIDIQSLPSGNYIIRLIGDQARVNKPFVIHR